MSVIPKVRLIDFMAHIIVDRTHSRVDITNLFSFSLNNCVIFYYFSLNSECLLTFKFIDVSGVDPSVGMTNRVIYYCCKSTILAAD